MAKVAPQNHDEAFSYIAQQAGSINNLLDSFFGFLHRKTDFYVEYKVPTNGNSADGRNFQMGFPEGVAKNIVLKTFKSYPMKKYEDALKVLEESAAAQSAPKPPSRRGSFDNTVKDESVLNIIEEIDNNSSNSLTQSIERNDTSLVNRTISESIGQDNKTNVPIRLTEAGKQIPIGNGGVTDRYYWTQTLKDITVYIDVPVNTKSKEVKCTIKPSSLSLVIRGEVYFEGALEEVIRSQESMWTISSEKKSKVDNSTIVQVVITLEKIRETWWKHVIVGDPEIDTSLVDSTKNICDYDEETQGTIRKILFDQKQRALGLPTSEEIQLQKTLQYASTLPNSPI